MNPHPSAPLSVIFLLAILGVRGDVAMAAPPPPAGEKLDWQEALNDAAKNRERFWKRDFSSKEAYEKSVEPNRQHLRSILGIKSERLPTRVEYFGTDEEPAVVAENPDFQVLRALVTISMVTQGLFTYSSESIVQEHSVALEAVTYRWQTTLCRFVRIEPLGKSLRNRAFA